MTGKELTNYNWNHPLLPSTAPHLCIADKLELHVRHIIDTLITSPRSKSGMTVYYYPLIKQLVVFLDHNKTAKDYAIAFARSQRGEIWLNGVRPSTVAGAIVFLTAGFYGIDVTPKSLDDQFLISRGSMIKMAEKMVLKRVPLPYGDTWNDETIRHAEKMQGIISRECNIKPSIFTALDHKEQYFNRYSGTKPI